MVGGHGQDPERQRPAGAVAEPGPAAGDPFQGRRAGGERRVGSERAAAGPVDQERRPADRLRRHHRQIAQVVVVGVTDQHRPDPLDRDALEPPGDRLPARADGPEADPERPRVGEERPGHDRRTLPDLHVEPARTQVPDHHRVVREGRRIGRLRPLPLVAEVVARRPGARHGRAHRVPTGDGRGQERRQREAQPRASRRRPRALSHHRLLPAGGPPPDPPWPDARGRHER